MRNLGITLCLALIVGTAIHTMPASESRRETSEGSLKAAFLLNFLRFVTWPDEKPDKPFIVAILGRSDVAPALARMVEAATVRGHSVLVIRIGDLDEIADCHILFIPEAQKRSLDDAVHTTRNMSVLTVSESDGAAIRGACVNLVRVGDKLRLIINKQSIDRVGLRISPQLLKVSTIVVDGTQGGE